MSVTEQEAGSAWAGLQREMPICHQSTLCMHIMQANVQSVASSAAKEPTVSHSAARQNRPVLLGLRASMAKDRLRPAECNRKGTSVLHCGRQR